MLVTRKGKINYRIGLVEIKKEDEEKLRAAKKKRGEKEKKTILYTPEIKTEPKQQEQAAQILHVDSHRFASFSKK